MPIVKKRREKIFGLDYGRGMDRNLKTKIEVYAEAWSRANRRPGQHFGPLTLTTLKVLHELLRTFHNNKSGRCFPSHKRIAQAANCAVSTVAIALDALEAAGILTWVNRLVRVTIKGIPKLIRTSNAYAFSLPGGVLSPHHKMPKPSKSDNRTGTLNQDLSSIIRRCESVDNSGSAGDRACLEAIAAASRARFEQEWLRKRRI